jgi:integral membrane protein (TIGR01906 family)
MCVAPIIVGILCAIDFDKTFILFHQIAFSNNDWYFDPLTDPVILILPHSFFLQCAVILIISVLLGAATLFAIYFITKNKKINLRNQS